MLEFGESFKSRKGDILFDVRWSARLLRTLERCKLTFPQDAAEYQQAIIVLYEYSQYLVQQLIELKRWRIKNNIEEEAVWTPKGWWVSNE